MTRYIRGVFEYFKERLLLMARGLDFAREGLVFDW